MFRTAFLCWCIPFRTSRFSPRTLNDAASLVVLTQQERRLIEMAFHGPTGSPLCERLYETSALDMIGDVRATATKRLVSKRRKRRRLMPPLKARALSPPPVLVKLGPLADKNSNNEFWQGCTRITRNTVRVERRGVVATRAGLNSVDPRRTSAGRFEYETGFSRSDKLDPASHQPQHRSGGHSGCFAGTETGSHHMKIKTSLQNDVYCDIKFKKKTN